MPNGSSLLRYHMNGYKSLLLTYDGASQTVGLIEKVRRGDTGVAVEVPLGQLGKKRRTLVLCIIVTVQPQELRAVWCLGAAAGGPGGHSVGAQHGLDMEQSPDHVTTLLAQAPKICTTPEERHV